MGTDARPRSGRPGPIGPSGHRAIGPSTWGPPVSPVCTRKSSRVHTHISNFTFERSNMENFSFKYFNALLAAGIRIYKHLDAGTKECKTAAQRDISMRVMSSNYKKKRFWTENFGGGIKAHTCDKQSVEICRPTEEVTL